MSFLKKSTLPSPGMLGGVKPPLTPPKPKPMPKPTLPPQTKDEETVEEVKDEKTIPVNTPKKAPSMPLPKVKEDIPADLEDGESIDLNKTKEEQIQELVKENKDTPTLEVKDFEDNKEDNIIVEPETVVEPEQPVIETTELKVEEKPKSKRTRKKKEEVVSNATEETQQPTELYDRNVKKISIDEMEEYLSDQVTPYSESWELEKEEISNTIRDLRITSDMNPGQAKVLLEELAEAQFVVTTNLTAAKTNYENLVGDNGLIKAVKAINSKGTNADDRKVSGLRACMNYVKPGATASTDLLVYERLVRDKFYFYENANKQLEFKRQLLITFNSMLNIESRV